MVSEMVWPANVSASKATCTTMPIGDPDQHFLHGGEQSGAREDRQSRRDLHQRRHQECQRQRSDDLDEARYDRLARDRRRQNEAADAQCRPPQPRPPRWTHPRH